MLTAGSLFILSTVLFVVAASFLSIEENRGRLFLNQVRGRLDRALDVSVQYISDKIVYLGRYILKLSWYYGIHKFLRFILTLLVKSYDLLERWFLSNRERARVIKLEKKAKSTGHLSEMAKHKEESALSPAEKKKLLTKKLTHG
jgi:hypothetical protein